VTKRNSITDIEIARGVERDRQIEREREGVCVTEKSVLASSKEYKNARV
jgi:hypothetical protein